MVLKRVFSSMKLLFNVIYFLDQSSEPLNVMHGVSTERPDHRLEAATPHNCCQVSDVKAIGAYGIGDSIIKK